MDLVVASQTVALYQRSLDCKKYFALSISKLRVQQLTFQMAISTNIKPIKIAIQVKIWLTLSHSVKAPQIKVAESMWLWILKSRLRTTLKGETKLVSPRSSHHSRWLTQTVDPRALLHKKGDLIWKTKWEKISKSYQDARLETRAKLTECLFCHHKARATPIQSSTMFLVFHSTLGVSLLDRLLGLSQEVATRSISRKMWPGRLVASVFIGIRMELQHPILTITNWEPTPRKTTQASL